VRPCRAGGGVAVGPGDRVRVHGAPITIGFGERRVVSRVATVERASTIERLWTKFTGHFRDDRTLRSQLQRSDHAMNAITSIKRPVNADTLAIARQDTVLSPASTPPTSPPWTGSTSRRCAANGTP
jgi:hypothetical protein